MLTRMKEWFEVRLGIDELARTYFTDLRVPRNVTIFSTIGSVVLVAYIIEAVSGILLFIYYVPHPDYAFRSVQAIMNSVPFGWLFRQIHIVGSNLMIAAVVLHMVTVFLMGNYKRPRELTWALGALMLLAVLLFGLSGYLLPWSQLSYWATTVVTSIPTAIPLVGDSVLRILRGGESITGTTLSRFFALHVAILPPIFLVLAVLHMMLIKRIGISATPFGRTDEERRPLTEFKKKIHPDGHPYFPNFLLKQTFTSMVYLSAMFFIIALLPTLFLPEEANTPADPFRTPAHIRPEWYLLAPYQMLRIIPNKFLGISLQIIVVLLFIFWPFIDVQKEKNILKRPVLRGIFIMFLVLWALLTYMGRR